MKILLYEPINQIQVLLVSTLIQNGFKVFALSNKFEIIPSLTKAKYDLLICDTSKDDEQMIDVIKDIKSEEALKGVHIILHVKSASKDFLMDMVKVGVSGFILKPFVPAVFTEKFNQLVNRIQGEHTSQRKHIRISPGERESAQVSVRSNTTFKLLTGKVINISMGGVLFSLIGTVEDAEISVKQLLKNVQIKFRTSTIETNAVVVAKKSNAIALKFFSMPDYDKNILSRYIYENMVPDMHSDDSDT